MIKAFILRYAALLVLAGAAALLLALGVQTMRLKSSELDFAHLQSTVSADTAARANANLLANQKHRDTEQSILADAAETKKADDATIRTLAADAVRLERMLRDRPRRPPDGPANLPASAASAGSGSGSGSGATGAQLYAEDGAVLVGEAARAQKLIVQRDSCIRQYHDAEKRLNGGGK